MLLLSITWSSQIGLSAGSTWPNGPSEAGRLESRRRAAAPNAGARPGDAKAADGAQLRRQRCAAHRPAVPNAASSGRLSESASQRTSSQRAGGTVATRAASSTAPLRRGGRATPPGLRRAPTGPTRAASAERRHDQGDRLVADGETQAEQGAGDPAGAFVVQAAGEEDEAGDRAQDLRVVVVDAAGPELRERHRAMASPERGRRRRPAGRPRRSASRATISSQREEQQRRPERCALRAPRRSAPKSGVNSGDQQGERQRRSAATSARRAARARRCGAAWCRTRARRRGARAR